jgi:hypothetical protein
MKLVGMEVFIQYQHVERGNQQRVLMLMPFNTEIPNESEVYANPILRLNLFDQRGCVGSLIVEIPKSWLRP